MSSWQMSSQKDKAKTGADQSGSLDQPELMGQDIIFIVHRV